MGNARKNSIYGAIQAMTITEEEEEIKRRSMYGQQAPVFREFLAKPPVDDVPEHHARPTTPVKSLTNRRFVERMNMDMDFDM